MSNALAIIRQHSTAVDKGIVSFDKEKDNLIIKGNNLLALHTLKEEFAGKVKVIYIDPPYNTGNDGFGYNDKFQHSAWMAFMKNRLQIAYELLSEDGSIWINLDDNETHYLKVLSDEIFGRTNFVSTISWQKIHSIKNDSRYFSVNQDFLLVYAKNKEQFIVRDLPRTKEMDERYKNPDNDPRGPWQSGDLVAQGERTNGHFIVKSPSTGKEFDVASGKHWVYSQDNLEKLVEDNQIWFGKDGNSFPRKKRFLKDITGGRRPSTIWLSNEVGHNQEAKRESISILKEDAFGTPKPERLIQQVLTISTNESDLVLDFFMGSATTQAVAMKMNRRFIGIEQMDYINTVSVPRLQKVIEGEQGGISKDVNWQGGGSFVYAELFPKNMGYLQDVIHAKDLEELNSVYERMLSGTDTDEPADISFRADLSKIDWLQGFDENKRLLVKLIDKNGLYYNYSEIDDSNVRDMISDSDYTFNKFFYEGGD